MAGRAASLHDRDPLKVSRESQMFCGCSKTPDSWWCGHQRLSVLSVTPELLLIKLLNLLANWAWRPCEPLLSAGKSPGEMRCVEDVLSRSPLQLPCRPTNGNSFDQPRAVPDCGAPRQYCFRQIDSFPASPGVNRDIEVLALM